MHDVAQELRDSFKAYDDVRDAGQKTPEGIKRYDDIAYGEDEKYQVLDVYLPESDKEAFPVIVSVHGGGWVYGDKERYQYYCMSLAKRGFAVVNFTYRLAPEYKFPCSVEDTYMVFEWVYSHATEYRLDTSNVFAVGDSAGAHILGLYCNICTNETYAQSFFPMLEDAKAPKAVALNCGVYDVRRGAPTGEMTAGLLEVLLPYKGTEEELDMISVCNHVTYDFPPTFIMTCTGDGQAKQVFSMVKTLTEKNIPFEYHYYGDRLHELGHVFHLDMRSDFARICNDEECSFFRKKIDI